MQNNTASHGTTQTTNTKINIDDNVRFDGAYFGRVANIDNGIAKLALRSGGVVYRHVTDLKPEDEFQSAVRKSSEDRSGNNYAVARCVMKSALIRMNEVREKCPGVGGDIDAMNLGHMIQNGPIQGALNQAADRLESLSRTLKIDAEMEVAALREIASTQL